MSQSRLYADYGRIRTREESGSEAGSETGAVLELDICVLENRLLRIAAERIAAEPRPGLG